MLSISWIYAYEIEGSERCCGGAKDTLRVCVLSQEVQRSTEVVLSILCKYAYELGSTHVV